MQTKTETKFAVKTPFPISYGVRCAFLGDKYIKTFIS